MKEAMVIIERIRQVSEAHQHLELAVEPWLAEIKPGQSILARTINTWNPYLREQWYPVTATKTLLTIERPLTSTYTPGQVVDVLGIVGKPYRFRKTLRNVLLLAYNTEPTPLLLMIDMLLKNRVSVTLVPRPRSEFTLIDPPSAEPTRDQKQRRADALAKLDAMIAELLPLGGYCP